MPLAPAIKAKPSGCVLQRDGGFVGEGRQRLEGGLREPVALEKGNAAGLERQELGFGLDAPERVAHLRDELDAAGVRVSPLDDNRPAENYVTFRCWDPDDTEIEVFWEA